MTLRRYATTRDTGLDWLGRVPEHWDARRLKGTLSRNDSGVWGSDSDESGVTVLRSTEQTVSGEWSIVAPARRRLSPNEYANGRLKADDLVLTTSSGSARHIGKTSIVTRDIEALDCCFSNFMQRLRIRRDAVPRFIWYVLNSQFSREQFAYLSSTTTGLANLNGGIIGRLILACPPRSEQAAIVRFLDHADRRIRRYIRAKEKLIELLEEYKQAVIHEAVTGQIDVRTGQPYPAYKDSGVEWLGMVPAHWPLVPLKWIAQRSQNGATPPTSESAYYEGGAIPWYGPSSLLAHEDEVGPPVKHLTQLAFSEGGARLLRGPSLLVAVIGNVGKMALMAHNGATNQQITAFEMSAEKVNPRFILRQIRRAEPWLQSSASAATIPILDSSTLARLPCALPSIAEQHKITTALDAIVCAIGQVAVKSQNQIALAHEFRTRLIADVVTGKLDVREAAAALPDLESPDSNDILKETTDSQAEQPVAHA